jgi:hypothetical protein
MGYDVNVGEDICASSYDNGDSCPYIRWARFTEDVGGWFCSATIDGDMSTVDACPEIRQLTALGDVAESLCSSYSTGGYKSGRSCPRL